MVITELLERNAVQFPEDVALVEINPPAASGRRMTWKEYSLIEGSTKDAFRTELTWKEFDRKANRFANLLLSRGIEKGDKVAILLMNCLEWLPIYFGILKTGALAVPLNYRYTADEIKYCTELSEADVLIFGPEFTGRVESICNRLKKVKYTFYVGDDCPTFAESYDRLVTYCSTKSPDI
ncbi:MAG: class I adenylate-forming enzyme family protein, partial [Clostridia bacterium]|nr:class I adenylate-forming enzyme family protein [Clostridia bacterium]